MRIFNKILTSFFLALLTLGCSSEPKAPQPEDLIIGKWEIQQGYRNGRRANSLDGLFFHFNEGQKMVSNMFGTEATSSYSIAEKIISQTGDQNLEYRIMDISEQHLTLLTTIQGTEFRLVLTKE